MTRRVIGRKYVDVGANFNKVQHPEMELLLEQWMKDKRDKGFAVTGKHVKHKAKKLVDELTGTSSNVKASNG